MTDTPTIPNPLPPYDQREKLIFTRDEARDILYGRKRNSIAPLYKVVLDEICDISRWLIHHWLVIQRLSDGKFYGDGYSEGATESQDESPWEYNEPAFREVWPVPVTNIEYQ